MDEKSLPGEQSTQPSGLGQAGAAVGAESTPPQENYLAASLKSAAALSGGSLAGAVDEFLEGRGKLHETTRAAVAQKGASSVKDLAALLVKQFKLSPAVGELVAALLVKLLPKAAKEAGAKEPAEKKKPCKTKPRTSAKKETGKTAKKPAKKPVKKETGKSTAKPKTAASKKKPKAKRSETVEAKG